MNIIFIMIDTMRYDYIGANGATQVETPNIDRLAEHSWCFDRAFCASFPTIPCRNDVMTGRYGGPFHPWKPLPFDVPTFPAMLGEAGYATQVIHDTPHLVNGGHNFDWPFHAWTFVRSAEVDRPWVTDSDSWPPNWRLDPLFDCLGKEGLHTLHTRSYAPANRNRIKDSDWNCSQLFETASEFLRDNKNRANFFLYLDCFDPHEPWDAPPEFMRRYNDTPGYDGLVDPRSLFWLRNDSRLSDEARRLMAAQYPAKVAWMDHCFGTFLDTLESTGLIDSTAIIFTGDHGTNVGERGKLGKGAPVREQEGHVPLFIRMPEGDTGRSDIIVQPQDFFATVMGMAGQKVRDDITSHDVLSAARAGESGRSIGLAGMGANSWNATDDQGEPAILFTAFTDEWVLEVAQKPEHSRLSKLGSLEYEELQHPDIVSDLHIASVQEIARRGIDPGLLEWLRNGEGDPPEGCRFWDGWPGQPGFHAYFRDIYTGP
ncbi:MAG: sulfatase [Gemmatimonadota bacterium]|nr:sulfatase [Gemmatimonadota bacterium]